jgi:hypothetical protein
MSYFLSIKGKHLDVYERFHIYKANKQNKKIVWMNSM